MFENFMLIKKVLLERTFYWKEHFTGKNILLERTFSGKNILLERTFYWKEHFFWCLKISFSTY